MAKVLFERKNTVAGAMTTVAAVVTTKENVLPLNGTTDAANDGDLGRTSMYRKKFLFVVIFVFLLLFLFFFLSFPSSVSKSGLTSCSEEETWITSTFNRFESEK